MNPLIKQFHDKQIENLVNKKLAAGLATETATTTAFTLPVKGKKVGGKDAKKPKKKKKVERAYDVQLFNVGDTVDVHYKIIEGEKERIQIFTGIIIRHKGTGLTESITVRRIVQSEGVERIFPLHSPKLMKVIVTRRGIVRRAKLYFLRDRVGGKATKVPELLGAKADRLKKRDEMRQTALDQKLADMAAAAEANKPETTES